MHAAQMRADAGAMGAAPPPSSLTPLVFCKVCVRKGVSSGQAKNYVELESWGSHCESRCWFALEERAGDIAICKAPTVDDRNPA